MALNFTGRELPAPEGHARTASRAPVVVVGASPFIKTIYSTVRTMDKSGLSNVSFADTLDQARTFLKARNHSYTAAAPNPLQ